MKTLQTLIARSALMSATLTALHGVPVMAAESATSAQATPLSAAVEPHAVLTAMERVADWQLTHPSIHPSTDWTQGVGDTGMMALAGISGNRKYRDAMVQMGEANDWRLGPAVYFADDQVVGQTYLELYQQMRQPKMLAPMRAQFDTILANPHEGSLIYTPGTKNERWSWCDALFMAPPAWMRLYAATGDVRYMNYAVANWWRTSDYLYDKNEHLFFRDNLAFERREANGQKIYWGRGNGWVMGALVRMLQYLPADHLDRARFEQQFKDMAIRLVGLQQADGLWRASLLDPAIYPMQETSGASLIAYGFAWGMNQGLLDRAVFEPSVRKAWRALLADVQTDGKLTHVQPIGHDPRAFDENATEVYGVGSFLLMGSEMYRLAVLDHAQTRQVAVRNPASVRRVDEIAEVALDLATLAKAPEVMDAMTSAILPSQIIANKLLFQVNLAPGETRRYLLLPANRLAAVPPVDVKTTARFVPERLDDFAWENDRIAHRVYGPAIMSAPKQTVSSGVDVWVKSVRYPIIDKWYKLDQYHVDHGEGVDNYDVGTSRGCGGISMVDGKTMYNSSVYTRWKILANGPLRSVFELTYDNWNAGDRNVAETARISIDAGSNFSRVESVFTSNKPDPLVIGVGIAKRKGAGHLTHDEHAGALSYWEPEMAPNGSIACGVLVPGKFAGFLDASHTLGRPAVEKPKPIKGGEPPTGDYLALGEATVGKPFVYYFGAGWSKSGDFPAPEDWESTVHEFSLRLKSPLVVSVQNTR